MRRKSDMPDGSLLPQFFQIINKADLYQLIKIRVLIYAVEETKVYIVHSESLQLPLKSFPDGLEISAPAVFSLFIIHRTEMNL